MAFRKNRWKKGPLKSRAGLSSQPECSHVVRFYFHQLNGEEADRRRIRRERNKVAAAKCRQRRVDHTNILVDVSIIISNLEPVESVGCGPIFSPM